MSTGWVAPIQRLINDSLQGASDKLAGWFILQFGILSGISGPGKMEVILDVSFIIVSLNTYGSFSTENLRRSKNFTFGIFSEKLIHLLLESKNS